jgi:hypothetical protein
MLLQAVRAETGAVVVVDASPCRSSIRRRWRCCWNAAAKPCSRQELRRQGAAHALRDLAGLYGVASLLPDTA